MRATTLRCRNCGAYIDVPNPNMQMCYCQYCGSQNWIDNGNRTIHKYIEKRDVDEAAIIRAKTAHHEVIFKEVSTILAVMVPVVAIIALIILGYNGYKADLETRPDRVIVRELSAGDSDDYIGKKYEKVQEELADRGFTNISTIDLDDSGINIFKNNKVESVTIDGNSNFSKGNYFAADADVVIRYH